MEVPKVSSSETSSKPKKTASKDNESKKTSAKSSSPKETSAEEDTKKTNEAVAANYESTILAGGEKGKP